MKNGYSDLTAIVPLDLEYRPKDIIEKAKLLAIAAEAADIPIIFGLNDRNSAPDRKLKDSLTPYKNVQISSAALDFSSVNMSALRNLAFSKVKTKFITLLDVDIWPDFELLTKYKSLIESGNRPYYFLPCIYLTVFGSKKLLRNLETPSSLTDKYFSFSRKEFLHLASPSSVTVMKSDDFRIIRGFNQTFVGHGYEDFDFMIRLASIYNEIEASSDFLRPQDSRSPLFATGFKKELGRICFSALLAKDFTYHLHHSKDTSNVFNTSRPSNFETFKALHNSFSTGQNKNDNTLISDFLTYCKTHGQEIKEYSALFENKPGHIDRYDTFRRKIKFLLDG